MADFSKSVKIQKGITKGKSANEYVSKNISFKTSANDWGCMVDDG